MAANGDSISSTDVGAALEQLRYVQRLLRGGENVDLHAFLRAGVHVEPALLDGNGTHTSAGLSSSLVALLKPLTTTNPSSALSSALAQQAPGLSVSGGVFQPRQALTLASELVNQLRESHDGPSDRASNALRMARQVSMRAKDDAQQADSNASLFSQSSSSSPMARTRNETLLHERKRRADLEELGDASHQEMKRSAGHQGDADGASEVGSMKAYTFPGQDNAVDVLRGISLESSPAAEVLESLLANWRQALASTDAEAFASLSYSMQALSRSVVRVRLDIDQVGVTFVWIRHGQTASPMTIERINILAESEVFVEDGGTMSAAGANDATHARPSSFPLYRQVTAQLLAKILHSGHFAAEAQSAQRPVPFRSSLLVIVNSLFALASLCHLHDPFPSLSLQRGMPPRGTVAVLSALRAWSPVVRTFDKVERQDDADVNLNFLSTCSSSSVLEPKSREAVPGDEKDGLSKAETKTAKRTNEGWFDGKDPIDADLIARLCAEQYRSLGKHGAKPGIRPDGRAEWTVLSGVVVSWEKDCCLLSRSSDSQTKEYRCVTVATGVKAQPVTSLSPYGDVLHDCHAEVLARRGVRSWMLQRLIDEINAPEGACDVDKVPLLFRRSVEDARWHVRDNVSFHLYCSTLPCGDLSSSIIVPRTTLDTRQSKSDKLESIDVLRGRESSYLSRASLRTKPGRPQAAPSISMSCSDKIALWSLVGFQGSLLSRWIKPVPFSSLVIGDESPSTDAVDVAHTRRSVQDTLEECQRILREKTAGQISGSSLRFLCTSLPFVHGRLQTTMRVKEDRPDAKLTGPSDELDIVPSAASLVWIRGRAPHGVVEGRKQGAPSRRKMQEPLRSSFRSCLSKLDYFQAVMHAEKTISLVGQYIGSDRQPMTYFDLKNSSVDAHVSRYRLSKDIARGLQDLMDGTSRQAYQARQVENFLQRAAQTSSFNEDLCIAFADLTTVHRPDKVKESAAEHLPSASTSLSPLRGWLVSGQPFEHFDLHGLRMTKV